MEITIVGAGVAGLATALSLHAAGFDRVTVFEAEPDLRPHGLGLNILPNAVRELAELGLLDELQQHAVRTRELAMYNTRGDLVWREDRGTQAGYRWPQLSISRARLVTVLADAVRLRLGDRAIVTDARLVGLHSEPGRTYGTFMDRDGTTRTVDTGLLIGADGIHSAVRATFYPAEGPPPANGMTMYRGTAWGRHFLTGSTMAVLGDDRRRLVLYPIDRDNATNKSLINWVAAFPDDEADPLPPHDRTDAAERRAAVLRQFGSWAPPGVDLPRLLDDTADVQRYPMIDRDPIPRWSFNDVTLVGDAAHAMYPAGSNGATQAIVDARVLSWHLATHADLGSALRAYEDERRPQMTELQHANRSLGPEKVITLAHQRAPHGFTDVREVFSEAELAEISRSYARTGRFDQDWVNSRPSLGVARQPGKSAGTSTGAADLAGRNDESRAVKETGFITAVIRAMEHDRPDAYLVDRYARLLSTPVSRKMTEAALAAGGTVGSVIVRARFGDIALQAAADAGITQVVCLAAGSDTRAWRLDLPSRTRFFEVDLPGQLETKERMLEPVRDRLVCRRASLGADLRHDTWPQQLRATGYEPAEPTVWIIEGLLPYLEIEDFTRLIGTVRKMSTRGSVLLVDAPHTDYYTDPANETFLAFMTSRGSAFQLGFDDLGDFLRHQGWTAEAYTLRQLYAGECSWLPAPPERLCPPRDHHWVARAQLD
ncbi:SAM-dependent methyltransferase [Verrucosispora sp. WMMD1129]|uniref:SAM-dependent methyltransferase n=1 Tax=Verrucosispora sp. WMMD1129 TaxID=3016093 RepID=UPI00249BC18B|nr:SAM-dependent methyltransferase [Verrucosispora sp. WMMD1129]WFE47871.1 SAM-dependent methyltransferase [Verrucosispora sp. WMMD1129]